MPQQQCGQRWLFGYHIPMEGKTLGSRPVQYIERTRSWYQGLGYGEPYRWAQYADVPFQKPVKALEDCRVALVTTAAPYQPERGDQGPGAPYNASAKFYSVYRQSIAGCPDVRISHIAYDRHHTAATDYNTWFPLEALKTAAEEKKIGRICEHFFGLPTNRSQKTTVKVDAPALLELLRIDHADVALLVANCPVCHQSVSLAARHLEANGIPSVVLGCARDIVENVGVPRFVFSDFPLGNAAGKPDDPGSQTFTLGLALDLLANADQSRTTVQSPLVWSSDSDWKLDYCNIDRLDPHELKKRRADFDAQKKIARQRRVDTASSLDD